MPLDLVELVEAVSKMAFGNKLGVELNNDT